MGRPFLVYSSDGEDASPSADETTSTSGRDWHEEALSLLEDRGYEETEPLHAILRWIYTQRRTAFLPRVEAVTAPTGPLETRVGGKPYLRASEEWPTNNDKPLAFLWQFRVQELPSDVQRVLGISSGLLQVFIDEELDEADGKAGHCVRVLDDAELVVHPGAADVVPPRTVSVFEEKAVLRYQPAEDFPHVDDLYGAVPASLDQTLARDVIDALAEQDVLSTVVGDKLLGWPNWCQGAEWVATPDGAQYVQVMQVEGVLVDFTVGDSGTLLIQRHPTDRTEWDVSWACC